MLAGTFSLRPLDVRSRKKNNSSSLWQAVKTGAFPRFFPDTLRAIFCFWANFPVDRNISPLACISNVNGLQAKDRQ
jgi:hypothetical protein